MKDWIEKLQKQEAPERVYRQCGWVADTDGGPAESFVFGNVQITPGAKNKKVTVTRGDTINVADMSPPEGASLAAWRAMYDTYNVPDRQVQAFASLVGFAGPLMALVSAQSCIVSLFSVESGSGKSTVQKVIASMFGSAKEAKGLLRQIGNTGNADMAAHSVAGSLPIMYDEFKLASLSDEALSTFIYDKANNVVRQRMNQDGSVRDELPYLTLVCLSTNDNILAKLSQRKGAANAQSQRIVQIHMPKPASFKISGLKDMEQVMEANRATAGMTFMEWVVPNKALARKWIKELEDTFEKVTNAQSEDRLRVHTLCCMLIGLRIALKLNLCSFDFNTMAGIAIDVFNAGTAEIRAANSSARSLLLNYTNKMAQSISRTSITGNGLRTGDHEQRHSLRFPLVGRHDMDEQVLYLSYETFKEHLVGMNRSMIEVRKELAKDKLIEENYTRVNLALGTGYSTQPAKVFKVDLKQLDKYFPTEGNDEQ